MKKQNIPKEFDALRRKLSVADGTGIYLMGFILLYLMQMVFLLLVSVTVPEPDAFISSKTASFLLAAFNQLAYAAAILVYSKIAKFNFFCNARTRRLPDGKQAALLVLISFVCIAAFSPLAQIFIDIITKLGYKTSAFPVEIDTWGSFVLSLITIAMLPAIVEEFLFRGGVARSFSSKGYVYAMIWSGILFGLIHGNAEQFVHQTLLGVVMAFVYFATRSIWSAVLIHFVNNATALTIYFVGVKAGVSTSPSAGLTVASFFSNLGVAIVAIFILIILLRVFYKMCKNKKAKQNGTLPAPKRSFAEAAKAYFVDFGRAFFPKGIVSNVSRINEGLGQLFELKQENDLIEEEELNEQLQIDNVSNSKIKEELIQQKNLRQRKRKKADIYSLVTAISLVSIIWLYSLISGFLPK